MPDPAIWTEELLQAKIKQYNWYHEIQLTETLKTPGPIPIVNHLNQWLQQKVLAHVNFAGKRVLDIGCREGLYSFLAEKQGATEVIGIDNDLSDAAVEFLIPYFDSKVQMHALNLYDLTPEIFGTFDVIILFGVVYHLKFPFWGLKRITDCLNNGGMLLISTAILNEPKLNDIELMYCPGDVSGPFGYGCPTYFNAKALNTTLHTMQLFPLHHFPFTQDLIALQTFFFQKNQSIQPVKVQGQALNDYYYGSHHMHTGFTPEDLKQIYQQGTPDILAHWNKLQQWQRKL